MDRLFDTYAELLAEHAPTSSARPFPKEPGDSDFVYRQAIRAKAFDAVRGILPAASLSNVGIYGTGQGYEALLLRMRAHPLPEARAYADLMLDELRKVIPIFLTRVDLADRGVAWSALPGRRPATPRDDAGRAPVRRRRRPSRPPPVDARRLRPRRPRTSSLAAMLLPAHPPARGPGRSPGCARSAADERLALLRAYVGERANRRHKPGRALERVDYRFDVLADYGAFRDLQRHRMLTIEWQPLDARATATTRPEAGRRGRARPSRSTTRWTARPRSTTPWPSRFPAQAAYAVSLAYRVRFVDAVQRPRGDAPARAAHRRRRATRRTAGSARRCTA